MYLSHRHLTYLSLCNQSITPVLLEPVSSSSLYYSEGGWKMIQEGWNYAENVSANKRPNICSTPIYVRIYIYISPLILQVIKCSGVSTAVSVWKEQEKVLATAHQQSRMEREESEVRAVLYFTWTRVRGVMWHIAPSPPDDDCSRRDWRVCPPQ